MSQMNTDSDDQACVPTTGDSFDTVYPMEVHRAWLRYITLSNVGALFPFGLLFKSCGSVAKECPPLYGGGQ